MESFTQLTNWDAEKLKAIVSDFRGSEAEFIKRVDRVIPEGGSYAYSSRSALGYGRGYSGSGYLQQTSVSDLYSQDSDLDDLEDLDFEDSGSEYSGLESFENFEDSVNKKV